MTHRLSPGMVFGLRFFAWVLLCSLLFWVFSLHLHLGPVQNVTARLASDLSRLTGGSSAVDQHNIIVRTLTLNVNHECTGIFVWMLFASFVLAYPVPWVARVIGLGVGIPLLFAINVVRLATLARIVEIYPAAFFYFHEYVWQGFFMVCVLVGAIAWAERYG